MTQIDVPLERLRFGQTSRSDSWWLAPASVFAMLTLCMGYATWAAFQGDHYHFGPYLSPLYSPELLGNSPHSVFGAWPSSWPAWLPASPAILILWAPGGFRFTCYYYRGAYYKAFWADPPACAVGEPRAQYRGEQKLPLILQNIHRYFMYLALLFLVFLSWDVWKALWFENPTTGQTEFGIGLGTLLLTANVALLGSYTFGCHSFRHLIGGFLDQFAKAPLRKKAYDCATCFNRRHMLFAWLSLFGVTLSDLYVRLLSMGVIHDWRLI